MSMRNGFVVPWFRLSVCTQEIFQSQIWQTFARSHIFFFKSHLMCISKRKHFWGCICSAEETGLRKEDVYTTWKKYLVCVAVSVLSQLVSTSNSPTELYKLILYCVLTKLLRFVVSVKFTFFFPPLLYQWLCLWWGYGRGKGCGQVCISRAGQVA